MEHVVKAEALGVQRAFVAEDVGCRDAFQLVALAGGGTSSVQLTIAVANPYLRSPDVLARGLLSLDEMTGGRVTLGLGSSGPDIISDQLGLDYGDRVRVMRRSVREVHENLQLLAPDRRFRIILAAMGPKMLRLAGMVADGVLLNTGTTPEYIRWALERIEEGCDQAGRDPASLCVAVWVPVYVGPDDRSALDRARKWAAAMLSVPMQGELLMQKAGLDPSFLPHLRQVCRAYPIAGSVDEGAGIVPSEVARRLAVVGNPEEVPKRLSAYVEAGANVLVVAPGPLKRVVHELEPRDAGIAE